MEGNKLFVKVNDKMIEVKPITDVEGEYVESVTDKEKCEVISKWLEETQGYIVTPEKILKCKIKTPSGRMLTALSLYWYAKCYFEEK